MYIYIYVYIYAHYIYICINTLYIYLHYIYTRYTWTYTFTYLPTYLLTYLRTYLHTYIHMYVYIYIYLFNYLYIYILIQTYLSLYIYTHYVCGMRAPVHRPGCFSHHRISSYNLINATSKPRMRCWTALDASLQCVTWPIFAWGSQKGIPWDPMGPLG